MQKARNGLRAFFRAILPYFQSPYSIQSHTIPIPTPAVELEYPITALNIKITAGIFALNRNSCPQNCPAIIYFYLVFLRTSMLE